MAFVRYPQFVGTEETTLWANPSPTSSFSAQAMSLSSEYTDFDYVKIVFRFSTTDNQSRIAIIPKETLQASNTYNTFAIGMNSGSGNTRIRGAYASSATSIQIGQSYQLQSSSQTASNDYIIPTSIVGIKTGAVPTFFNTDLSRTPDVLYQNTLNLNSTATIAITQIPSIIVFDCAGQSSSTTVFMTGIYDVKHNTAWRFGYWSSANKSENWSVNSYITAITSNSISITNAFNSGRVNVAIYY